MRKFLSIIFFLLTIFGIFAKDYDEFYLDNKLVGAIVRSLEGNVVIPKGAELVIKDYQVPYYYRKTVTTSGLKLPGLSGAVLESLNGRDFTDAFEDNIGIASAIKALRKMDDVKDLAPAMQFVVQVYQIAEDFSERYKQNGGDTLQSALGTTMSHLGFTKIGDTYVPSGVGFYKSVITTEKFSGIQRTSLILAILL